MLRRQIVGRARERAAKRAWLESAGSDRPASFKGFGADSGTEAFTAKVSADDPDYKERVAEPTMEAIDALPKPYLDCVWEYDYVDVYRAWRRGVPPARIREIAQANGGRFKL